MTALPPVTAFAIAPRPPDIPAAVQTALDSQSPMVQVGRPHHYLTPLEFCYYCYPGRLATRINLHFYRLRFGIVYRFFQDNSERIPLVYGGFPVPKQLPRLCRMCRH